MFNVNFNHVVDDVKDALQSLFHKRVRSLLSAAGIAIGTTALVTMLSISEGAKHQAEVNIMMLGVDSIRIESIVDEKAHESDKSNLITGIRREDIQSIKAFLQRDDIGFFKYYSDENIIVSGNPRKADILLVNPDWFVSENVTLSQGRFISESDKKKHSQICLVGADIAKSPMIMSSIISWKDSSCHIIGTLRERGKMLIEGSVLADVDIDNSLILPISQYSGLVESYTGVTIKVGSSKNKAITTVADSVRQLLNQTHRVKDYSILLPITLLEKSQQEQKMFNLIMGTIAGLSLLVGGIGIMNVMLAHIAEQTREIGLRLSVGAEKNRIIQLFLAYSLMLAAIGTIIGVSIGIMLTLGVQFYAGWPIKFSFFSLTVGPIFALLSGVIFGLYPALKASEIQPNIALRQI